MKQAEQQATEFVPISELSRWKDNYRLGNVDAIVRSITQFGFNGALCVHNGTVMAGNHSHLALEVMKNNGAKLPHGILLNSAGDWCVPVIDLSHLSIPEARAFALASNRTQEMGSQDDEALLALLREIQEFDEDNFAATGYTDDDLQALIEAVGGESEGGSGTGEDTSDQVDKASELQEKWQTALGQLWIIKGRKYSHRLLCGDSCHIATYETLMDGELADCMWTDPPYGVSYEGKTKDALTIENDGKEGLDDLLKATFKAVDGSLKEGAAIYIAHPAGALSLTFLQRFIGQGWRLHETLVWIKDSMVLGHSDYHYKHEPILFGYKAGGGRRGRGGEGWYGDNSQTSVLEFPRPKASELHPTMKNPDMIAYLCSNSCPNNGKVIDPFCGSGSTLIACEQTGKFVGYGIELDPRFVAVTLERMALMDCEIWKSDE